MIYSISGKIGSGKDLAGEMLEYILGNPDDSYDDFKNSIAYSTEWTVKKWADILKDIVCVLINCTRDQLEDRDFKEKELGYKWSYYYLVRPSSGKKVGFTIFDNEASAMVSALMYSFKVDIVKKTHTPRTILQLLGTEAGRKIIHPNIWVNALMSSYNSKCNWIITDTRFENELDAVKSVGGKTIILERGWGLRTPYKDVDDFVVNSTIEDYEKYNHPSETALDHAVFDHVINNNKSQKHLFNQLKSII